MKGLLGTAFRWAIKRPEDETKPASAPPIKVLLCMLVGSCPLPGSPRLVKPWFVLIEYPFSRVFQFCNAGRISPTDFHFGLPNPSRTRIINPNSPMLVDFFDLHRLDLYEPQWITGCATSRRAGNPQTRPVFLPFRGHRTGSAPTSVHRVFVCQRYCPTGIGKVAIHHDAPQQPPLTWLSASSSQ